MKMIINGFQHRKQFDVIFELLSHYQATQACVILSEPFPSKVENVKSHLVQEIIDGNYGEFCENFLPTSFLDFAHPYLFSLINMTTRFEVYRKNALSFEERKKIVFRHFSYWYNYFQESPVDIYISCNIPHDIYDYVILIVAKYFKTTKIQYFLQSQLRDMIIPMVDYKDQNLELKNLYESRVAENQGNEVLLHPLAEIEWNRQVVSSAPFYMKPKKRKFSKLLYTIASYGKNTYNKVRYNYHGNALRKTYTDSAIKPNFASKFIYYPMHYQPEMTTCPLGGHYNDQYLAIKQLDALLPDGVYLYVKEHPNQKFAHRYPDYYKDLLRETKRTVLVDFSCPSSQLIKHSLGVAIITGTAGWEALFQKKPVLMLGNLFFQYAPGVFHATDSETCAKSLAAIVNNQFQYDENKLKLFLNCIIDTSIHGFIDAYYATDTGFSFEESNTNILNYIKSRLSNA